MKNIHITNPFADPRRRALIITILVSVAILGLIVILVVKSVSTKPSTDASSEEVTTAAVDDLDNSKSKDISDAANKHLKPVDNSASSASATAEPSTVAAADTLPATGPAETAAAFLVLGSAIAFVASKHLSHSWATRTAGDIASEIE